MATKYVSDEYLSFHKMAKVGGIGFSELQRMEAEFLGRLNYNLFVSEIEYQKYEENIFKLFCMQND